MEYSAIHKKFVIQERSLEMAAENFKYAIKKARQLAGVPLGKRKSVGPLTDLDHLEKAILDAAKAVGIDFGVQWGYELDFTD